MENRLKFKLGLLLLLGVVLSVSAGERTQLTGVLYRVERGKAENEIVPYVERVFRERFSVVAIKKLGPKHVRRLQAHLKKATTKSSSENFCGHEPGFAVILFKASGTVVYEASYCFKCDTIGRATKSGAWTRLAMAKNPKAVAAFKAFLQSFFAAPDQNMTDPGQR